MYALALAVKELKSIRGVIAELCSSVVIYPIVVENDSRFEIKCRELRIQSLLETL